jgi:hypothetical protein
VAPTRSKKKQTTYGLYSRTFSDYGGEKSTVTVPLVELGAANIEAQEAFVETFITALQGVMIDPVPVDEKRSYAVTKLAEKGARATNPLAQRECKWLVLAHDVTTKEPVSFEIPQADLTKLSATERGKLDLDGVAGTALRVAVENFVINKETGNLVEIDEVRHVGRNT